MHLKRLEIVGFKSFFDHSTLSFKPGVTAVVGPNGCGKSNIADAIQWALGEQSAKTLRGERMEDVIFNGTERRKPLGMAEVSLTFSGLSGELEGPLAPYREINITRRLYRSGESEYLINKTPCRLKDIRELLIDAGVGYHAHTIIEQGKVDALLNASPMERREIIEETAGIAKYRLRKTEALRKLEATDQNLARVRDIIGEVRRQMNSLDRQAKKAERYKRIMAEIRELDLRVAIADWKTLRREETDLSDQETHVADALQGEKSGLALTEGEEQQVKLEQTEKQSKINTLRQEVFDKEGQMQRLESRIELLRSQSLSWREEADRISEELTKHAEDKERLKKKEEEAQKELASVSGELQHHESVLQEGLERVAHLEEQIQERIQGVERERQELFEVVSNLTQQKNSLYHLKLREEELQRRSVQGSREKEEVFHAQEVLRVRFSQAAQRQGVQRERLTKIEGEKGDILQKLQWVEEQLKEYDSRLSGLREARVEKKGALASLQSFYNGLWQTNAEGHKPLKEAVEGVHGMVIDLIEVPSQMERAIEAVLDSRLRGVIVEGSHTIRQAVAHLKENASGREVLIPRQPRCREEMPFPLGPTEEILGIATRLISPRPGYEAVVEHLLGRVLIVKDLDVAFKIWEDSPIPGLMVTLDGEVIDPGGMVLGGKGSGEGLLEQKRAIRTLEEEIVELNGKIDLLEPELERLHANKQSHLEEIDRLSELLKQGEIEQATQKHDLESLQGEQSRLQERLSVLRAEAEAEEAEIVGLSTEISDTAATAERLQQEQLQREQGLHSLQAALDQDQQSSKAGSEEATRHRVVVASQLERREHLIESCHRLQQEEVERSAREEDRREQQKGLLERLATAELEAESAAGSMRTVAQEREETVLNLRQESESLAEFQQKIKDLEDLERTRRKKIEELQEEMNRLHLGKTDLSLRRQQLEESIHQQYQLVLGEIAQQSVPQEDAKEIPLEEAKEKTITLKQQVSEMGPVNIGAIDEHKELEERHRFLSEQESDLSRSMNDLHEAINKINKTTRTLFIETFNALNERFAEVFASFFGGGTAELSLLEEDKPLESGVEILVQPPGKRLRGATLLSGGEKALTAISLLFASFLIHPSPFCLLDELDAPLDDENTRRFSQALQRMSEKIQFIVVTHNKQTMEIADLLYGVTMEEFGISKMVSVRLGDPVTTNGHSVQKVAQGES